MAGEKITCATCRCEVNKKCSVKKGQPSVALNKRRRCDEYILEATKVKAKQILKTVQMGYKDKEALRREYKEQLKQFRSAAKQGNTSQSHPLTGDLSRFTSTVGSNSRGG
jgi:hypothetical protein